MREEVSRNCPDCGFTHLNLEVEDGEMRFFCENCGWQKVEEKYFYLTAWHVEIRQALAPVDILQSVLTDIDIAKFLRPRLKGLSYLSRFADASDEYLFGEIKIAYQVYLKQMIVLATTYVELILKDFFECLLTTHPKRMNKYLSFKGTGEATITLNEIINEVSKENLMLKLTERAASVAVGPKFDKVVEKIIKECKLELQLPLVEDLRALNELRNRVVHENTREEINIQQVHKNFGLLLYLLYVLGRAAKKYRIPYWDDCGFLEDFKKQLQESQKEGVAG